MKNRKTFSLISAVAVLAACGGDNGAGKSAPAADPAESGPADTASAVEKSAAFATTPLIDPNTASEEVLAEVPGMTETAAAAVIGGRPFASQSEMDAAIGDALDAMGRETVYAQVFVKVGLNSGAEDDYKLIPSSLSPRKLAHEFEEYRPYESLEQFSREMSKYVSDEEVAYLNRFVTLD